MALEQRQNFLKGINRRFSREDSANPEFFYTLQNARIFNRGDTGKVQRIDGYTGFVSTGTDYSNALDLIEFQGFYVALYEDISTADRFWIEAFDNSGNSVYSQFYDADVGTSSGKLTSSDDTIFIAPHNKVLYYDGSWMLEDFKSGVPTISGQSQTDAVSANLASGSIEPTSGVSTTNIAEKATAEIKVLANNTVINNPDSFTIDFVISGDTTYTTSSIGVDYQDTEEDIALAIYNALTAVAGITAEWDISMTKNQLNGSDPNSDTIYLTAKTAGDTRNGDSITIVGSTYNIVRDSDLTRDDRISIDDLNVDISPLSESTSVSTIDIQQPAGGIDDTTTEIGPLYIRISSINHTVRTENLTSADSTAAAVADKIETALNADSIVTDNFTVSRATNTISLEAKEAGAEFNGEIIPKIFGNKSKDASVIFDYTKSDLSGGGEVEEDQTLKRQTDYWYKARYKYADGHVSEACFPVKINTGASRGITLTFDTNEADLDGGNPKLQIFRKEEGQNFFLIDEIDVAGSTTNYSDDGKPIQSGFEPANLVWSDTHYTQTIIDQRYIRANITYPTEVYTEVDPSGSDFGLSTTSTTSSETLPNNTRARFYIQPQYADGTKGYFQFIGDLNIDSTGLLPVIDQASALTNTDKTIEELAVFVNYKPHAEEHPYKFNSIEFANEHISTIGDSSFFPSNPRVFFGFKYIEVWDDGRGVLKVAGWDSSGADTDHRGFTIGDVSIDEGTDFANGGRFPRFLNVNINGRTFEYVRYGYRDAGGEGENAVYKLADFEALKKAAATGDLKIRLTSTNVGNLSSKEPDDDILGTEVNVTSIIDKSAQYADLDIFNDDVDILIGPYDTRIYLELDDSRLNEIDNENLTRYNLKQRYDDLDFSFENQPWGTFPETEEDITSFTMAWELTNFKETTSANFNSYSGDGTNYDGGRPETGAFGHQFFRYDWDYTVFELTSLTFLDEEDSVILIGRKENHDDDVDGSGPVTFTTTGIEFKEDNELQYGRLLPSNIYSKLTTADEINLNKNEYKNQLIWSEQLRLSSGFSGGRTFKTDAFFNIDNDNGDIIDVVALANRAYVFCERGVAVVNIGEVLTTQKGGSVSVDSSQFMTNYYWIADQMVDIKEETIVKYNKTIYFSDGFDVYALSADGLQNITQGIINLDPSSTYYAGINPEHNEYQICDYSNTETWIFNFEFQQWYGPFTYRFKNSAYLSNQFITMDDSLYEHGSGNTFAGTSYTTLIESVANDTEASFYDKTYRKFYIASSQDGGDTTFSYGKTTSTDQSITVSNMKVKNGYKHQGVHPDEANNKVIYWDISTTNDGFELSDISWKFQPKRRR